MVNWTDPFCLVRALFTAIRALEGAPKKDGPAKAGGKWEDEEVQRLIEAFDAGSSIKELALSHQRTTGAIRSRLVKLGKLERGEAEVHRFNPKPDDDIPF